jgi:uncharacterized RDD family membrane protein YckC
MNTTPLYAGFWRRVAAVLIDSVPLATLSWIVGAATNTASMFWWHLQKTGDTRGFILGTLTLWLYYALLESSSIQGTLGKLIMGLYVTDEHGKRLSFGRASGRHFGKYLSVLIFGIGFLMAGFTAKKQALHDLLAHTLVMRHPR